ncbi:helix-turn-helix domain-containing protein, partial [Streptomyces chiangmaiensis]
MEPAAGRREKGIWKESELQRSLAEHGLVISAGKMSGLWSGQPVSLKLEDLDAICVVLGCQIGDLLIPSPRRLSCPASRPPRRPPLQRRDRRWCPAAVTAARRPQNTAVRNQRWHLSSTVGAFSARAGARIPSNERCAGGLAQGAAPACRIG